MDVDARIEALQAENDRLRDELDQLKETLGLHFVAPIEFRLTPQETRLFGRLLRGGLATKDALMATLYRELGRDEVEIKIIDVFVCKLRRKLKPFGLTVQTVWGQGYQMPADAIARFNAGWGAPARVAA